MSNTEHGHTVTDVMIIMVRISVESDHSDLVSGQTLQLLCTVDGARPAATIRSVLSFK